MKTPKLDPAAVGKWLSKLSDVELIDFFSERMRDRNIYRAEGRYRDAHLVLAVSSRDREDNGETGPWGLQVLAPAVGPKWTGDAPVCQFGTCTTCGHKTASVSRTAQCPVCLEPITGG
jgi:hypothetical protein